MKKRLREKLHRLNARDAHRYTVQHSLLATGPTLASGTGVLHANNTSAEVLAKRDALRRASQKEHNK